MQKNDWIGSSTALVKLYLIGQSARGPIKTASSQTHRGKKAEKADGTGQGISFMSVYIKVKKERIC